MIPWSSTWDPSPGMALLALMMAGHGLAEFLFQTRRGVEDRRSGRGGPPAYLSHGAVVLGVHLAVALPLLSLPVALVLLGISVFHVAIDWIKDRRVAAHGVRLRPLLLDQAAHAMVVLGGWGILAAVQQVPGPRGIPEGELGTYVATALLAAAFAVNAMGGGVLVEGVLRLLPEEGAPPGGDAGYEGAGRLIGILERTLTLPMVLFGQWGAIGLLLAAKSIARFEELKVRKFAEYYLVGTLMSLLVALTIGFLLTGLLFTS